MGAPTPNLPPRSLHIDCATCAARDSEACDDCVVSFIVSRVPGDAIVIDASEERALRTLADAGLVPELRHRAASR